MTRHYFRPPAGRKRATARAILALAASAALAAPAAQGGTSADPSSGTPAVTISLSGSTAMKSFTNSKAITDLTPGTSITLSPGGTPVTYWATQDGTPTGAPTFEFQLAAKNNASANVLPSTGAPSGTGQVHALRVEWHEQGSVEGVIELASDQIGYLGAAPLAPVSSRNPIQSPTPGVGFSNPIWVNGNAFNGRYTGTFAAPTNPQFVVGPATNPPGNITLVNNHGLSYSDYNTYSSTVANPGGTNFTFDAATGKNLQGGQDRVQMGISDVNANQAFSISGASGSFDRTPLVGGYGKGNTQLSNVITALPTTLVQPGSAYQLKDQTVLNMSTDKIDPQTGHAYAAGQWNNAGLGNLQNNAVAVTATLFVANPGTGLDKLNRSDAQWIQTTGRLKNGAMFNMTTRDAGSGTRNVAALNTGVDPSWAVGSNDAGNGNSQVSGYLAADQASIGPAMLFSNKTSGGGQLRPTVQNNRMALGTLSLSDTAGTATNNSSAPLRALDYTDATTDGANADAVNLMTDANGRAQSGQRVRVSAANITNGGYTIYQNETYVTIKAPNAAYAGASAAQWANLTDAQTGIKGDTAHNDVAAFRSNILTTVNQFTSGTTPSTAANPADGLLATGFILPQMMRVEKTVDGVGTSSLNSGFDAALRGQFLGSTYVTSPNSPFTVADPASITSGTGSTYGNASGSSQDNGFNGKIKITANGTGGNYLFGNFNQNGVRDFAAVKTGLAAALALQAGSTGVSVTDAGAGSANTVVVSGSASYAVPAPLAAMFGHSQYDSTGNVTTGAIAHGAEKGDLIAMGDFNGDGRFDGRDIWLMARGAALSDAGGSGYASGNLTTASGATLGDQLRNGVLRKNAAMDYVAGQLASATDSVQIAMRQSAESAYAQSRDAANHYLNAFNKLDVNHDGVVNIYDAKLVNQFQGKDITSLNDQLNAVVTGSALLGNPVGPSQSVSFNLVDAELTDKPVIDSADLGLIKNRVLGDFNMDGVINSLDINPFVQALVNPSGFTSGLADLTPADLSLIGDFNGDGKFDALDINGFVARLLSTGMSPRSPQILALERMAAVPEPSGVALIGAASLLALRRRRRSAC